MSNFQGDSIFWIEVDKIKPNPYQPRREFDEEKLRDLAESIRQYGVLQPLTVTRTEVVKDDGGLMAEYELIAGERRLRAAKLAGVGQVPALIRSNADDARTKLELAIIENLQREDLNPVDRARAFERLHSEFGFKHNQIGEKIGKSREYISNTLRLLLLPEEILIGLGEGKISEGHARTLLMLEDRPEEQMTIFKEVMYKKLTVRETEAISRRVAYDRIRKKEKMLDPQVIEMEQKLTNSLGTRVKIEQKESGGKIVIDFFSPEDLGTILNIIESSSQKPAYDMMENFIAMQDGQPTPAAPQPVVEETVVVEEAAPADDRSKDERENEAELYAVRNFSL